MIKEFSISPKQQNKNASYVILSLFFLAAIFMVTYFVFDKYKGIFGLVALVFITAALTVYNKYLACKYCYEIMIDSSGVPLFLVSQAVGKKRSLLCRVMLSSITEVKRESKKERAAHKLHRGNYVYSFCPTLFPESVITIYADELNVKNEIVIEGNDDFLQLLNEYSKIAREMSESVDGQ